MPLPALGALASVPLNDRRRYPQLGNVGYLQDAANANYNSLQTSLEKRFSSGLSLLVAYTYAHGIDSTSDLRIPKLRGSFHEHLESSFRPWQFGRRTDQRHRASISYQYALPFGRGKTFLNNLSGVGRVLVEGWTLGGITQVGTGLPFGVITATPSVGNGVAPRPDYVADPTGCSGWDQTINSWLNLGVSCNRRRDCMATPAVIFSSIQDVTTRDVSLFKEFAFKEQRRAEFRVESFNLANHPNFRDLRETQ